jgi:transposase InsO family protein
MTSTLDRQHALELVNEARASGARLKSACAELGIGVNTYRRWSHDLEDKRPSADRPTPAHALSEAERQAILDACHRPDFASLPPAQIVTRLLDEEGTYIASESSFYRVLRAANEQHHRGRAAPPRAPGPPPRHMADGPNQVWAYDVTYLPTHVRGVFLYLYLVIDVFSRKIVGAEVFEAENAVHSSLVVERAVLREQCAHRPLILHADNGSPMKGSDLRVTLERLGITPSHSRPRVSNDNAFSEALFRTCKYRPDFPVDGFDSLQEARLWVLAFVQWYNHQHRRSAIRFVTPAQRHQGLDVTILAQRKALCEEACRRHPRRWSRPIRNWDPVQTVWLNTDWQKANGPPTAAKRAA